MQKSLLISGGGLMPGTAGLASGRSHGKAGGISMLAPDEIENLVVWYKADAITGVADGGSVNPWPDSGPNDDDISFNVASPDYVESDATLSAPAVDYNGSTESHKLADFTYNSGLAIDQPNSFLILCYPRASGKEVFGANDSVDFNDLYIDSGGNWYIDAGTDTDVGVSADLDAWSVVMIVFDGADTVVRVNGTDYSPGDPGTRKMEALRLGLTHTAVDEFDGRIAEFAFWDHALTSGEMDSLDAWIKDKYSALSY